MAGQSCGLEESSGSGTGCRSKEQQPLWVEETALRLESTRGKSATNVTREGHRRFQGLTGATRPSWTQQDACRKQSIGLDSSPDKSCSGLISTTSEQRARLIDTYRVARRSLGPVTNIAR